MENSFYDRGFGERILMYNIKDVNFGFERRDIFPTNKLSSSVEAKIFVPYKPLSIVDKTTTFTARYGVDRNKQPKFFRGLRVMGGLKNGKNYQSVDQVTFSTSYQDFYHFDENSIKEISIMYEKDELTNIYIKLKYLPVSFRMEIVQQITGEQNGKKEFKLLRQKSELWSDSMFINCITSQLTVRITGTLAKKSYGMDPNVNRALYQQLSREFAATDLLKKEFGIAYKDKGIPFVRIPDFMDEMIGEKLTHGIDIISEYLEGLPFKVLYSFMCLFSTKKVHILDYPLEEYIDTIKQILHYLGADQMEPMQKAMDCSIRNITYESRRNFKTLFENIEYNFDLLSGEYFYPTNQNEKSKKAIEVRRIIVTPSRMELEFPSQSVPNRAIRTHLKNLDDFVCVSFQNEDHQKGMYAYKSDETNDVLNHIEHTLKEGFLIGSKRFKFLHYSNSQMKSYSCWFMNEVSPHLVYDKVIKVLGNFDHVSSVSKNAARRGQAFSSAVTTVSLDLNKNILEEDDIKRNGFEFTDGCGEIDPLLLNQICESYFNGAMCSAVQIRMGGYKGMLMASQLFDGDDVQVKTRRSMRKFDLDPSIKSVDLEVVRLATYMPGYLNKQVLLVLWANGIEIDTFLGLQRNFVGNLIDYFKLKKFGSFYSYPEIILQSFRIITTRLYSMHAKDIPYHLDPFIAPMIKAISLSKFKGIKKKFRIYDESSCNLIGVADPYGVLEAGEVFVQFNKYAKFPNDHAAYDNTIVEGKVLVTRSPCVHPGDVRVLKAVKHDMLLALVNVIVFSVKGKRPDQNKMGCGDLDGDIYWINWRSEFVDNYIEKEPDVQEEDKKQVEDKKQEEEKKQEKEKKKDEPFFKKQPRDFTDLFGQLLVKGISKGISKGIEYYSQEEKPEIGRLHCIENFINFLKKDILGQVANLHCKIADSDRKSINGEICLELAKMHAHAVDNQKKDTHLDAERFLELKKSFKFNSDFMYAGKFRPKGKRVFKSPGVLGRLYRDIENYIPREDILKCEYKYKIMKKYDLPDGLLDNLYVCDHIVNIYVWYVKPYNDDIRKLMIDQNLCSEGDLFNSTSQFSNSAQRQDDYIQTQEQIRTTIEGLQEKYLDKLKEYQLTKAHDLKSEAHPGKFKLHPVLDKAIKLASYFNPNHFKLKSLANFKKRREFRKFIKYVTEENAKHKPISYTDFERIVNSNYSEENEISRIVHQAQIFSAWWILGRD
ncbi:unnamed protein product [Moneuplotes crassus]|uniref:RNA-dependent RNA polymerase n=2 Tax=Euplotes crassus TaxID=5936 RepID=A0AAD1UMM9_EUPCR|nr:unnamed protein product [Moneuplotes crassus]